MVLCMGGIVWLCTVPCGMYLNDIVCALFHVICIYSVVIESCYIRICYVLTRWLYWWSGGQRGIRLTWRAGWQDLRGVYGGDRVAALFHVVCIYILDNVCTV